MTAALKKQQEFDVSSQAELHGNDAVEDLDPLFAQAVQRVFDLRERGIELKVKARNKPYDALIEVAEQLREFGLSNNVADVLVDALETQATQLGADFTRKEKPTPLEVSITVADKAPELDKSKTHFMVAFDGKKKYGAEYSTVDYHLAGQGSNWTKSTSTNVPALEKMFTGGGEQYLIFHFEKLEGDGVDGLNVSSGAQQLPQAEVNTVSILEAAGPRARAADLAPVREAMESGKMSPAETAVINTVAQLNRTVESIARAPEQLKQAQQIVKPIRQEVTQKLEAMTQSGQLPKPAVLNAVIASAQRAEVVIAPQKPQVVAPAAVKPAVTTTNNASSPVMKADNNNTVSSVKAAAPKAEAPAVAQPARPEPVAAAPSAQKFTSQVSAPVVPKVETPAAVQPVRVAPVAVAPAIVTPSPAQVAPTVAKPAMAEMKAPETPRVQAVEAPRAFVQAPVVAAPVPQQPAYVAPVQSAPPVHKQETPSYTAPVQAAPVVTPVAQKAEVVAPVQQTPKIENPTDEIEEEGPSIAVPRAAVKPNSPVNTGPRSTGSSGNGVSAFAAGGSISSFGNDAPVIAAQTAEAPKIESRDSDAPEMTKAQAIEQTQAVQMKSAQDAITSVAASLGVSATALNISAAEIAAAPQATKQTLRNMAQKPIQQMMESQIIVEREEREADQRKEREKFLAAQEREADEKKAKEKKEHEAAMARASAMQQPLMQTMQAAEIARPKAAEPTQAQTDYEKFFKRDEIKTTTSLSSSFNTACSGNCATCRGCSVGGQSRAPAPTV